MFYKHKVYILKSRGFVNIYSVYCALEQKSSVFEHYNYDHSRSK